MPVMNGLMATRKMRAMDRDDAKTVPIIAMSADVFDESIIKARECGMTGYITKPLDMEALYDELETQIKIFKDLTDIKE
jgi:CheY-like chemotaxis protein